MFELPFLFFLQSLEQDGGDLPQLKRKEKRQLKHEIFLERSLVFETFVFIMSPLTIRLGLEASRSPYSKSHARRLKRKEKEVFAGGMDGLKSVISSLQKDDEPAHTDEPVESIEPNQAPPPTKVNPGLIGEGKSAPPSKNKRKQAL